MRVLLFGGTGTLGKELLKLDPEIIAPTRQQCNVNDQWNLKKYIHETKPDLVINAVAETKNDKVTRNPSQAINTNIIAAANIAQKCLEMDLRLCYISTDYIYKSDRGNYSEEDEILPFNQYAWTKLAGECATRMLKNHLIIRTSFGQSKFEHEFAFSDKLTSKDYVDVIAPLILEAAKSEMKGVLNVGTNTKTIYEYAKKRNPQIHPIEVIKNRNFTTPKDSSMNLTKLHHLINQNINE